MLSPKIPDHVNLDPQNVKTSRGWSLGASGTSSESPALVTSEYRFTGKSEVLYVEFVFSMVFSFFSCSLVFSQTQTTVVLWHNAAKQSLAYSSKSYTFIRNYVETKMTSVVVRYGKRRGLMWRLMVPTSDAGAAVRWIGHCPVCMPGAYVLTRDPSLFTIPYVY
jgi:hypothetical protein